jgi:hypothetical protein
MQERRTMKDEHLSRVADDESNNSCSSLSTGIFIIIIIIFFFIVPHCFIFQDTARMTDEENSRLESELRAARHRLGSCAVRDAGGQTLRPSSDVAMMSSSTEAVNREPADEYQYDDSDN